MFQIIEMVKIERRKINEGEKIFAVSMPKQDAKNKAGGGGWFKICFAIVQVFMKNFYGPSMKVQFLPLLVIYPFSWFFFCPFCPISSRIEPISTKLGSSMNHCQGYLWSNLDKKWFNISCFSAVRKLWRIKNGFRSMAHWILNTCEHTLIQSTFH